MAAMVFVAVMAILQPSYASSQHSSNSITSTVPESAGPDAEVVAGAIELSSGTERASVRFEIYSITGQIVKTITVGQSVVRVELPKGFYIIKCDSWTRRVMLK